MLVSSQPVRKAGSTLALVEIKKLLIFPGRVGSARGFLKISSRCLVVQQCPAAVGSSETLTLGWPVQECCLQVPSVGLTEPPALSQHLD